VEEDRPAANLTFLVDVSGSMNSDDKLGLLVQGLRLLVDELGGTLFPIAIDVKIQVEFNPSQVAEYRLLGYETRILEREDFDNDTVDAGEIGNGHNVTAIYEIVPATAEFRWMGELRYGEAPAVEPDDQFGGELAFLKIRYKLPGEDTSNLISRPISSEQVVVSLEDAPGDVRFSVAVAAYGQLLRDDAFLHAYGFDDVVDLANAARGDDNFGYRAEFIRLADLGGTLSSRWSSLNE